MEYCCQHWAVARLPWRHLCLWGLGPAGNQGALSPHFLENFGVSVILFCISPALDASPTTSEGSVKGWETPNSSNKPMQHLGEPHMHLQQGFGASSRDLPCAASPRGQCQPGGDTAGAGHYLQSCAVPRAFALADNIQIPISKIRPRAQPCPRLEGKGSKVWGVFWSPKPWEGGQGGSDGAREEI